MKTGLLFLAVLISFFLNYPVRALEFELHDNDSKTLNAIMASGIVKRDDVERLDHFLSRQPTKRHTAIYLNSPGGSLGGGIRLGEYFRKNRIKTIVEGHEMCASACALAFLGGTDSNGNRWMSSTTTSRLGFHAFRNGDGTRYDDTDDVQQAVGTILQYGQMVGAPMEIFVRSFQTPSDSMYWFSANELLSLGIKVWDMTNKCFVGEKSC